jgi:arsenate reductase (glutaredoxin)
MKNATIYHNPRCSKSRQALQLLLDRGVETHIIEYLKSPLGEKAIRELLKKLGKKPRDIIRSNEAVYKALHLDRADITDNDLIQALVANPILIARPIVLVKDKAIIARPPETLLELI